MLLNVVFNMSKTLNGSQSLPSNIFIPPTFQYYLDSPASLIAFFTFPHFLFYFKLYKISYNPTPLVRERILSMKEGRGGGGRGGVEGGQGPEDFINFSEKNIVAQVTIELNIVKKYLSKCISRPFPSILIS